MVHYKLIYFNGRGAGESIRQLFVAAKVDYEDHRINFEDWPKLKETMPFHQMPVLEVDGERLPQSSAIFRYLSRKFGLAGKNPWEEAQVDALADQWKDFLIEITKYWRVFLGFGDGSEDKEKMKEEQFIPAVKKHFPFFVKALKKTGTGFLVGDSLTRADIIIAEFIVNLDEIDPKLVDDFPELREHYKNVHASSPEIVHWRETRPQTPY